MAGYLLSARPSSQYSNLVLLRHRPRSISPCEEGGGNLAKRISSGTAEPCHREKTVAEARRARA